MSQSIVPSSRGLLGILRSHLTKTPWFGFTMMIESYFHRVRQRFVGIRDCGDFNECLMFAFEELIAQSITHVKTVSKRNSHAQNRKVIGLVRPSVIDIQSPCNVPADLDGTRRERSAWYTSEIYSDFWSLHGDCSSFEGGDKKAFCFS